MSVYLIPYKIASKAARAVARSIGAKRLNRTRKTELNTDDIVFNWGVSETPSEEYSKAIVVNSFDCVGAAANKTITFYILKDHKVLVPDFTEDKHVAKSFIAAGHTVLARTIIRGHSGTGIVGPINSAEELPDAPLYVKYIKKLMEFRVHVVGNNFLIHRKKKKIGVEANYKVRSHANGWVFCAYEGPAPFTARLVRVAMEAITALKLDFGAVDIVYSAHYDRLYVLEINTAPGIENVSTLEFYTNGFNELKENIIGENPAQ